MKLPLIFGTAMLGLLTGIPSNGRAQFWHALPTAANFTSADYGSAAFSNDEKRLFFLSKENGVANVYSAPIGGGAASAITKFTDNGVVKFVHLVGQPFIVFERAASANDHHLFKIKDDGTGDVADLTPGGAGIGNDILGQTYNGRYVYYTSNKVDHAKIDAYRYDAMQNKNELIFPNDRDYQVLGWSRDTKNLLLEDPQDGSLSFFEISSTDRTSLAKPAAAHYARAIMDPASKTLMVFEKQAAGCEKKVLDFSTKSWTNVKEMNADLWHDLSDANVDWVDYSPNGKYILFHSAGNDQWSVRELPGGAVIGIPQNAKPLAISPKEAFVAYTLPGSDKKVYVYDIAKKTSAEVAAIK